MLKHVEAEGCFGDFWEDVFSLKITTANEREVLMKKKNAKPKSKQLELQTSEASGFHSYIRKVMLFNSTPKVNLVGKRQIDAPTIETPATS